VTLGKAAAAKTIFKQFDKLVDSLEHLPDDGEKHTTRTNAGALLENILRLQFLTFFNFWGIVLPRHGTQIS